MKYKNKYSLLFSVLALCILAISCQKLDHPALGNYPKDTNPPGGPLLFYAAMEGTSVDSTYANFGNDNSATYVAGVSGKAIQYTGNGYTSWTSANGLGSATSFSVSFWINITLAQKDNTNADGVLALASTSNFWGEMTWYADHSTGGNSDSMDLKVHFANGSGDNWDFANYVGKNRWPHMYDGAWHQIAFVYDANAKTGTMYRDGVQFDQKSNETIVFDGNASQLVLGGFEQAVGIQGNYAGNTWMSGFPGAMDNLRLYKTALAASDVAALYANKQ